MARLVGIKAQSAKRTKTFSNWPELSSSAWAASNGGLEGSVLGEARAGALIDSLRQLLQAATLGFVHPVTNEHVSLTSPLPSDFTSVVDSLTLR